MAVAALGLISWALGSVKLGTLGTGAIPMAPTTSLSFLLLGVSFLLGAAKIRNPWTEAAALISPFVVLALITPSLSSLLRNLAGSGWAAFAGHTASRPDIVLWKMSPITALIFLCLSIGLLLKHGARARPGLLKGAAIAAAAAGAAGFFLALAYLYRAPFFYHSAIVPVACPTSLAFLLFSAALLGDMPDVPPASFFAGNSLRADLLRSYLPIVPLAILTQGWIETFFLNAHRVTAHALSALGFALASALIIAWKARDISRRQERMAQELRLLGDTLRASVNEIYIFDAATLRFRFVSEGALSNLGYTAPQVRELTPLDLKPLFTRESFEDLLRPLRRGEKSRIIFETVHQRADGTRYPVEVFLQLLNHAGDRVFLSIIQDITERNVLEATLRQSQKMESVGRLAGGVAHDFNNLLTAINGYAQFVKNGLEENDPRRRDADEILAAGARAEALTRQLLAFSRKQALNPVVMDLGAAVEGTIKMLKRLIGENIKLDTQLAARACLAKLDAGQIDQVLMNLVINARDAMPEGGTITLSTDVRDMPETWRRSRPELPPGPLVRLGISDTGLGMNETVKSHLFEPFFTTKEKGKGTGLGLATVYGIVKQSGGEIDVESSPGRGTSFSLYFPEAAESDLPSREQPIFAPAAGRETVLVVEDEETVRKLVKKILEGYGYTVLTAADGETALGLLRARGRPVDLLLTDVVMPGINGPELAGRAVKLQPDLRTLYMSGYSQEEGDGDKQIDPRVFLYKPFTAEALALKVRTVLDGPSDLARA